MTELTPRLVVDGADAAIDFYRRVFGAEVLERYEDGAGRVVHAAIRLRAQPGGPPAPIVALVDAYSESNNVAPTALGGSPVMLNLVVEDVDGVVNRFLDAGGQVIFPLADQFYGHREGRFRDPFGHLWILTTIKEHLAPEEIEARMRGGS